MSAEWTATVSTSFPEDLAAMTSINGLTYADAEGNLVCTASVMCSCVPEEAVVQVAGGIGAHGWAGDVHMGKDVMCTMGDTMTCAGESWACSTASEDPDAEPFDMAAVKDGFHEAVASGDADSLEAAEAAFAEVCPMNPGYFTLVSAGMNADEPPTGNFDATWSAPMGDTKVGDSGEMAWMGWAGCMAEGDEEPTLCCAWATDLMPVTVVQGATKLVASTALAAYLLF